MVELKGKYSKDCKIFVDEVEDGVYSLVQNILNEKVSDGVKVRIMPDTHVGKGIVIGFTMPLSNMVNPAHIGVDIGCGIVTAEIKNKLNNTTLSEIDKKIRKSVPMGVNVHKKKHKFDFDYKKLNILIERFTKQYNTLFNSNEETVYINEKYITSLCKRVDIDIERFDSSIGSLGGGNHFIEFGENSEGKIFVTVHSGSRNFGNNVCKYHINQAKKQKVSTDDYNILLDEIKLKTENKSEIQSKIEKLKNDFGVGINRDYLQGKFMFNYLIDMLIATYYAELNRFEILNIIKSVCGFEVGEIIHSVHNYIDFEDFIIRKGAIKSYKNKKMVIPFNMRDGILVCMGKSNDDWNFSAPHGAGRVLSRSKAYETISMEDFKKSMEGIYSTSINKSTIDESPFAYKDAKLIESLIEPTAEIIDRIKPILNIKA